MRRRRQSNFEIAVVASTTVMPPAVAAVVDAIVFVGSRCTRTAKTSW
jgi:hypothetical protein